MARGVAGALCLASLVAAPPASASLEPIRPPAREAVAQADGTLLEVVEGEHVRTIYRFLTRTPPSNPIAERLRCDLDGDGTSEEVWARKVREEWDRDGDGRVDQVFQFDEAGALRRLDVDGDGFPDTTTWMVPGRPV